MKTIRKIIAAVGDMDEWAGGHIQVPNDPFMPLLIEYLGKGPYNGDLLAISHTYMQHGHLMRNPEIVFLVTNDLWTPMSFRNDSLGLYRECLIFEWNEIRYVRPELVQGLRSFAHTWDRNIAARGYLRVVTGK